MIHNPCSTWQYKWQCIQYMHLNIFDLCSLVEFCCIWVKDMFFLKRRFYRNARFYSGADSCRVDKEIMDFGVAHPEFRAMVLLVKHWRNLRFPSIRSITSYHLELLCMEVIEASESRNLRDLFREFLEWVAYSEDNLYVENPNYYHGALKLKPHRISDCEAGHMTHDVRPKH